MKATRKTSFLLIMAAAVAAGCMVTEHAKYHEPGGGTGVKVVDRTLDAFTTLEGNVGKTLHGGIKSSDAATSSAYHFTTGLMTSDSGPNLSRLQKARRKEERRRVSRPDVIEKIEKAKITVDDPILNSNTLNRLGLYLVWDTVLAGVVVKNIWMEDGLLLLETQDKSAKDYKLFAVNLHNGYVRWVYRFISPLDSRPTSNGEILWVSSASTIYPIDLVAGWILWTPTKTKFTVSSPIFTLGRRQYVGSLERAVYALNGADKYPDWDFGTFAPITAMPLMAGSTLYVVAEGGLFYAYNHVRNENVWQLKTADRITADPVQDDNNVYFGSEDFNVYCASKETGRLMWKFRTQGPIRKAVRLMDENTLLVRGEGSAFYALDKDQGTEKWRDAEASYPVALGRLLYVLTESGSIKALDPETGAASWEQPAGKFSFMPANLDVDAVALCTSDGQIFLIQEKGGKSLKPKENVAQAPPAAPAKD